MENTSFSSVQEIENECKFMHCFPRVIKFVDNTLFPEYLIDKIEYKGTPKIVIGSGQVETKTQEKCSSLFKSSEFTVTCELDLPPVGGNINSKYNYESKSNKKSYSSISSLEGFTVSINKEDITLTKNYENQIFEILRNKEDIGTKYKMYLNLIKKNGDYIPLQTKFGACYNYNFEGTDETELKNLAMELSGKYKGIKPGCKAELKSDECLQTVTVLECGIGANTNQADYNQWLNNLNRQNYMPYLFENIIRIEEIFSQDLKNEFDACFKNEINRSELTTFIIEEKNYHQIQFSKYPNNKVKCGLTRDKLDYRKIKYSILNTDSDSEKYNSDNNIADKTGINKWAAYFLPVVNYMVIAGGISEWMHGYKRKFELNLQANEVIVGWEFDGSDGESDCKCHISWRDDNTSIIGQNKVSLNVYVDGGCNRTFFGKNFNNHIKFKFLYVEKHQILED